MDPSPIDRPALSLRLLVVASETHQEQSERRAAMGEASHESYANTLAGLDAGASIEFAACVEIAAPPSHDWLGGFDGIFFAGSPIQMHNDSEATRSAAAVMREVFQTGVPSFGSCAGLQIAAVAAGGRTGPRDKSMETAFARGIVATADGRTHPLLDGRPVSWDAPAMHASIVTVLPESATLLASARHTPVEALEIRHDRGVFWGVQYHPELTIREIAGSLLRQRQALHDEGLAPDEAALHDYAALLDALHGEPGRADIAWRIGVDEEVTEPARRTRELSNFLAHVRDRRTSRP